MARLSDYAIDYARCRAYGHAWFEYDSLTWDATMGDPLTLRCERCGTERRDQIGHSTGELVGRKYAYPDGYKIARDDDAFLLPPSRSEYRLRILAERERREQRHG